LNEIVAIPERICMKLICPVSGTENENREECKQCGTDLRPLIQLAEFPWDTFAEGSSCLKNGQLTEAVELLATASTVQPDSTEIHFALARALARLGLAQHALSHFDRAISLAPERSGIHEEREALARAMRDRASAAEQDKANNRRLRLLVRLLPVATLIMGILLVLATQRATRYGQPKPDWAAVVQQRLDADPVAGPLHLKATPSGGAIRIGGTIPSEVYRDLVMQVAGRDVTSRVDVSLLQVPVPPPPTTYRVRFGDSWWTIARREYGNGALWLQLEKANLTEKPNSIVLKPGGKVVLPPITVFPAIQRKRGSQ
jgi:nucleoid-associated protein YgaU